MMNNVQCQRPIWLALSENVKMRAGGDSDLQWKGFTVDFAPVYSTRCLMNTMGADDEAVVWNHR